jgi:hypothetical protein
VPSCANGVFQNEVVRGQWGWDGFFVSDVSATVLVHCTQHFHRGRLSVRVSVLCVPFSGWVQCGAIALIYQGHHYTSDWNQTMRVALHDGGTDVACDSAYSEYMFTAYQNGSVSLADMQAAASNFLRQAFELGLMDPPSLVRGGCC